VVLDMSLAAALEAAQPKRKGPPCSIGVLLSPNGPLSDKDRATLSAALADGTVEHSRLAEALTAEGHKVGENAVSRHRRRRCLCEVVA
jgi:hypothetical protein